MQHIIAGNNVAGDDTSLGHSVIYVLGAHLQIFGHTTNAEDNKVQNLVVHLHIFLITMAKVHTFSDSTNEMMKKRCRFLHPLSIERCIYVKKERLWQKIQKDFIA